MLYVVAGTSREYTHWTLNQKTIRVSETRYVNNADQLRGLSDIEGRFIGTCYDRPDISQIVDMINMIRSKTGKLMIKLESLRHLTRYQTTDHSFLITTTTTSSWSQHNIPIANTGMTTASQAYLDSLSGKTATTAIYDEVPSSYKVPLSHNKIDSFVLVTAKLYKSYITNEYNSIGDTIDYYFSKKDEAFDFASKYNAVAYEYI